MAIGPLYLIPMCGFRPRVSPLTRGAEKDRRIPKKPTVSSALERKIAELRKANRLVRPVHMRAALKRRQGHLTEGNQIKS